MEADIEASMETEQRVAAELEAARAREDQLAAMVAASRRREAELAEAKWRDAEQAQALRQVCSWRS